MPHDQITIQCVFGADNIPHIETVLLPSILKATARKVTFCCLQYDDAKTYAFISSDPDKIEIRTCSKGHGKPTGFATNHNLMFNAVKPQDCFFILNPDVVLMPESLDTMIATKDSHAQTAIVEARQWPYEHPKRYDPKTKEVAWASLFLALVDSGFYASINGMDENYFLCDEDVDLSWQAWLNGYKVLYEKDAAVIHFSDGPFAPYGVESGELYYEQMNFIPLLYKFFGERGYKQAVRILNESFDAEIVKSCIKHFEEIKTDIPIAYHNRKPHPMLQVLGFNNYCKNRV